MQLSGSSDVPGNAVKILDILIKYLVNKHIDYAVDLGLSGINHLRECLYCVKLNYFANQAYSFICLHALIPKLVHFLMKLMFFYFENLVSKV